MWTFIITGFILGISSSLHCIGMCGPIAMALPLNRKSNATILSGALQYNLGRTITYALLGAVAGLFGLTVHFKIYPIIFAMVFYANLSVGRNFFNWKSIKFGLIAATTFIFFTAIFYYIYGWECLYESLLYHLTRKDHRHNFSIQFIFIYLEFTKISPIKSIAFFLPSIFLVILFTIRYRKQLIYGSFLCTFVFVVFNKSNFIFLSFLYLIYKLNS